VTKDLVYALRTLRRQPGFAAVVVVVLAAVIGLHATLATVLAGVLLRPWPGLSDPSRVVALYLRDANGGARIGPSFAAGDVAALRAEARTLDGVAAMASDDVRIGEGDAVRGVGALVVSANFFDVLGVAMAQGRRFAGDEDRGGDPRAVAILSYDGWRGAFGGDPAVVGRTIRVNDVPFTVVGIAAREFGSAEPAYERALFVPMAALSLLHPEASGTRPAADDRPVDVVARLARGATRRSAKGELDVLVRRLTSRAGAPPVESIVTDTAFLSHPGRISGGVAGPIIALALVSSGLALVWLIACANVGNLLLARAAARASEIAIRVSLGASRARIVRQLLTEGLLLGLAAGALGVAVAHELPTVILRAVGGTARFPFEVTPDATTIAYAVLLAAASAVAFGLAPALHVTRTEIAVRLAPRDSGGSARVPLRGVLLGVQVATSVVLLVSAALLVRGAQHQAGTFDPGFTVDGVSVVAFELPPGAYDAARRRAFFDGVAGGLKALPPGSIAAHGFATFEPNFIMRGYQGMVRLAGQAPLAAKRIPYIEVTPGFIDTLQIPIVAGRDFEDADEERPVVIVNETMARQLWPNESPIGRRVVVAGGAGLIEHGASRARSGTPGANRDAGSREVIGVMKDTHISSLTSVAPLFYTPMRTWTIVPKLLIRSDGPPPSSRIAQIAARLDRRIRVETTPLASRLEDRLREQRLGPLLAGVLGGFALVLATVGMSGVFAYAVRQRTREIGIRMALGAQPADVVRLILGGHSRAVVIGLAAGLLGALAASAILRSRLHGMSPFDPVAYGGVASLLALAGLAASYIPVRRAVRVDPVVALRCE